MKSFAMTFQLKDDPRAIERYKEYHRAVWPEVVAGLRGIGVSKLKVFLQGRQVFVYHEVPDDFDIGRDIGRYMQSERARDWDALMRELRDLGSEPGLGQWPGALEEVFDLEAEQA
jgi:L-rhamnose mutarotase